MPLVERGFFPPIENATPVEIREVLESQHRMNKRENEGTVVVPDKWGKDATFHLGSVDEEGFVCKVDLQSVFDGTKLVRDAAIRAEEERKQYFVQNPFQRGEPGGINYVISKSKDM